MSESPTRTSAPRLRGGRFRPSVALAWMPALLVLLPLLLVFVRLAAPAGDAWAHLVEVLLPGYVWQTLLLIALVVVLALALGVPTAWWVATAQFPGRAFFQWTLLLPLAMPGYVAAMAYGDALEGLVPVYIWVRQKFGIDAFLAAQQVARWVLAVLVLGATLSPYVYLTCLASFSRQTAGPLEAARLLGAGPARQFWTVALPMARPAMAAGASLVAFETINDYGVVSYFGLSPLTVGVFRVWLSEGDLGAAIRLAVFLLIFAMGAVMLERLQRGRRGFDSETGETLLARRRPGWAWRGGMALLCLIPLLLGFGIPGWRLGRWASQSWQETDWGATLQAAGHSFGLAGGVALLVVAAALLMTGTQRAWRSASLRVGRRIGLLGYAIPSALVAVGVGGLLTWIATLPGMGFAALSASVTGLVFAYFVRFLAVGLQAVDAGFKRVPASLHEAARTLGTKPWAALWRIEVPLVWPALLAAATLTFIDVFKELTLTLVLRPFNYETLATRIFRLTDESRIPEAATPALVLIGLSLLGLIPLVHLRQPRSE
ncbi:iron ABC transporter permease [Verrucomicrobium sp. BvORR034]|uniref:ABC transporter permease n=1 Tax=Verrucomicrobium sp. BvORR034 TaxID=1396418 RepID=UPI0009E074ED|nr:iron ABC transporter permease [Verrucomicrobium sp. BvORR034]